MGRREDEGESSRRHGRRQSSPSPARGADNEAAIRTKLHESGWKKRRPESESRVDGEPTKDKDKAFLKETSASRGADEYRSSRASSRRSRHSHSPRRRDREPHLSRKKASGSRRRSPSRSRSPASVSRSRSRSTTRRRRRHVSSSGRKRRSSRSMSRGRDRRRSRRATSRSPSTLSASKRKTSLTVPSEEGEKLEEDEVKQKKKMKEEMEMDEEVQEEETEDDGQELGKKQGIAEEEEEGEKDDRRHHRPVLSSRKSSRRSRSGSPRSPSRSSRRRRHRRNSSHSRSRSPPRGGRARRGGSRSHSPPRERRPRGHRDRDHRSRRRGRSYSRSRSASYSRRHRPSRRSSSRDKRRREANSSPEAHQHPPATIDAAPAAAVGIAVGTVPPTPGTGVNPTITQLMAQYPTMSLQDIIAKMQASNVTMAAAVAQKPARELYVGNLPPNVTGAQLQEFLSTIIQQVGLTVQPGNPIINTWISTDGHFAFCEMRSVEECNLALLLNQLSLLGQPLKFGRPRSFMGPPQPMPQIPARAQTALTNLGCTPNPAWFAQPSIPSMTGITADMTTLPGATLGVVSEMQAVVAGSTTANKSSQQLVMSNIPVVLAENLVKELVEPFGALKSFTLVKDAATGASTGSAVFEYEDENVAAQAVKGLNGLSIGGIPLSVQHQCPSNGVALGSLPSLVTNPEDQPGPVLKMLNMVSVEELRDDEEYADLAEDVEEECKRFGSVAGLEIPRPKDGEDVAGLGSIYVRFGKEEDAVSALKALNGRKFGGNIVKVTYFPVDKFEKHAFS
uniref:RRM domain-containing protein n=1 Tax=Peronospora matthiolae TaxID=2874970 RepID=A0AAV1VBS4_9STRA